MFTLGFSDAPHPNNLYILCVGYWGGGVAKYKLCGRPGRGGLLLGGPKRTRGGRGGINRFFCGRPLRMVPKGPVITLLRTISIRLGS